MKQRIVIITHRNERRALRERYVLGLLQSEWAAMGLDVEVVRGPYRFVPADLAILHVDLTRVPEPYLHLASRYSRCLNREITDISKSRINHANIARADHSGPVIVKTDLNARGASEAQLARGRISQALHHQAGKWLGMRSRPLPEYEIYPCPGAIPQPLLRDPRFVVEKFRPEHDGDLYCLRKCYFLGDAEVATLFRSNDPIIKGNNAISDERIDVADELRTIRRELRLDWGRIDYAIVDGAAVIYDANKTPGMARPNGSPRLCAIARELAPAIREFLP